MATLYFSGDQVALFNNFTDTGSATRFDATFVFDEDDIVELEIENDDIDGNGELNTTEVIYTGVTVVRDGVRHQFSINSGAKIKESGNGTNPEQGDTFIATVDAPTPPGSGPFSGLSPDQWVFALDDTFVAGQSTTITRSQDQDNNGDGDTADSGESANANFNVARALSPPVCFTPGTLIETPEGPRPVEDLAMGDLVCTADDGAQAIRWIGVTHHHWPGTDDKHKPIQIKAGALGGGLPLRDIAVSPQHRMLMRGPEVRRLFDEDEVLALAKGLTGLPGVRVMKGKRQTSYFSLLLDRHHILIAEGARTESFYPGRFAIRMVPMSAAIQILTMFPGLGHDTESAYGPPARRVLTGPEARALSQALREAEFAKWDEDLADERVVVPFRRAG